ncbi:class I SAM-dependent methyltransferase [Patescibacteria group bacterium]
MEQVEYKKMRDHEEHYWWHKGKLHLVNSLYEKYFGGKQNLKILEIGCGTGEVMNLLKNWGDVYGVDYSKQALEFCRERGFTNVILGDFNTLDLSEHKDSYDLVLSLDVLEHIRDDVETMKRVFEILKPGGMFFVSVPAYKFLWSNHDEALHHTRRYHSLEINQKIKDSGFEVVKSTHFVTALFFPIAFVRLMSNFVRKTAYPKTSYFPLPTKVNDLFSGFLRFEAFLIKHFSLPVGTTLVVVAKKPGI